MPSKIELFHGDCLEVMRDIPDGSVDMILCDLPYGTTRCAWDVIIPFDPLWEQYNRIVKRNGAVALFASEPFASHLRISNLQDYKYDWIWDKIKGTGFLNANRQPMRNHENILMFYAEQCAYYPQKTSGHALKKSYRAPELQTEVYGKMKGGLTYCSTDRFPRSVLEFSSDTQNSSLHPTQKPVRLCEYLINTYTKKRETVLDNCMGSGTTGVACLRAMRNFIGIEKEEKYFKIASERIRKEQDDIEQSLYYRACDLQE